MSQTQESQCHTPGQLIYSLAIPGQVYSNIPLTSHGHHFYAQSFGGNSLTPKEKKRSIIHAKIFFPSTPH